MADEISTLPFEFDSVLGTDSDSPSGNGFKFTVPDDVHTSEDAFAWEERLDIDTTITEPTYTQPFGGVFDSTTPDSELGGELETDHNRPPLGSFVFGPAYDGTCFILKDNLLYYCKPKQPEYWPALYFIEVSTPQLPLKTAVFHGGQVYVLSGNEIYYIQGSGHGKFFPLPMKAKTGAQSLKGASSVTGKGIFHTGPDGIYLFSSGSDTKITEDAFDPIFRGETVNGLPGAADMTNSWLHVFRNILYFGYRSDNASYPDNVLAMNLDTGRTSHYAYNDGSAIEIRTITTDLANNRILIGDDSGFVRVIESTAYTEDSDEPIAFDLQSKDFVLQTRKHFPRFVKYDVDASSADSCTGTLLLADEAHQTHTLNENRNTRRRLVEVGNGNRAALRISGTGQVTIYAIESE